MIVQKYTFEKNKLNFLADKGRMVCLDEDLTSEQVDSQAGIKIFVELVKNNVFPYDYKELLSKFLTGEVKLENGVQKLIGYYYFKFFINNYRNSVDINKIQDINKKADKINKNLMKHVETLLGVASKYGIDLGEEIYNSMKSNPYPQIFNDDLTVKEEFRKPRTENSIPEDYYKNGDAGKMYYPYAFRSGPNNPDVNHNLDYVDSDVENAFSLFRDFISYLEGISTNGLSVFDFSDYESFIKVFVDKSLKAHKEGKFLCDSRVFSTFDFLPTLWLSDSQIEIIAVSLGFISETHGGSFSNSKDTCSSLIGNKNVIKSDISYHSLYTSEENKLQYNYIRDLLCTSSFSVLYDSIGDYVYDKYLSSSGVKKYSTLHSLVTANIFGLLLFGDSKAFNSDESKLLSYPILKVDSLEYTEDSLGNRSITKISMKSKYFEHSGEVVSSVKVNPNSPVVVVFTDVSNVNVDLESAIPGISEKSGVDIGEKSLINPFDVISE